MTSSLPFRLLVLAALAVVVPSAPRAQQPAAPSPEDSLETDTVFLAAQRLVVDGRGDEGRTKVQRELQAAPVGAPRYVEALYWRAALAATAADAERDYRRLVVEYPASRRAPDALIALGQLEQARGDRAAAMRHYERVVREHPGGRVRSRASFWLARVHFEENNLARGCARLEDARRNAPADAVEMRNQLDFYGQRCAGVDTTAVTAPTSSARTPPPPSVIPQIPQPAAGGTVSRPRSPVYTIQVGAYSTRAEANEARARLTSRGYQARAVFVGTLWRVRIGRYSTREAAADAAARVRARGMNAFVTEAER